MNNRYREEEKEMQTEENIDDFVSENVEESVADEEKCECDKDQECCKEHGKGKKHNALKEKINKLEEENKKLKDQYYRTLADSENFKKRIDDERIRERKYGSQKLIEKLLNDLDIFDKAVNMQTNDPNLQNFLIGFKMINDNLQRVLGEEGVKKIKAVGEKFDPRYHNAIETKWDENIEDDIIVGEMLSGYMYKDRVIRASNVIVNKKTAEKKEDNE